jgi:prepilin-type N-terminal cleavage/methylation domain-containing protein
MLDNKKIKKTYRKRSAFTLIELSIVLIIIGLLVAGITGGASLIKSAELRAVMAEARDYKVAANAFKTLKDALPGDYATATATATIAGDGDGTIEHVANAAVNEGQNALGALYDAELGGHAIGGVAQATPIIALTISTDFPKSAIDTAGWTFGNRAVAKNVLVLTGTDYSPTNANDVGVDITDGISGNQYFSIDRKMDDGAKATGSVRSQATCLSTDAIGCDATFDL